MSNIPIELLDSRDEFRPGRSGGSVNRMQLVSGVLLLAFGLLCIFCPLEVLQGFNVVAAALIIVAGGINAVSYVRSRNTLFEQSGWSCFFAVMLIAIGVVLMVFPMVGVAFMGWMLGLGAVLFGIVQLIVARRFYAVGAGIGLLVGISGAAETVLGVLLCIWPAYLGIFIGLFAAVHAIDMIVFSLPIGRDRTNTLW
ncbi:MAG: DUF308 domain-containing protein [Slackia sp.]|nr:DUF308 domain-containing protein [Slackia sp.]